MITAAIIMFAAAGAFALICENAPVWDEDRQAPAETADATVERA